MLYASKNSDMLFDKTERSYPIGDKRIARNQTREYQVGPILEIEAYPLYKSKKLASRAKKELATPAARMEVNRRNSENTLRRIVPLNFVEWRDLRLDLTYDIEPTPEEAVRRVQRYLEQLRRAYKKRGIVFKYVLVSLLYTPTGKTRKRIHHHLVISAGLSRDEIENLWAYGRARTDRLQPDKDGLVGLTKYLHDQGHIPYNKRWSSSRNLIKPVPEYPKRGLSRRRTQLLALNYEIARTEFEKQYPEHVFLGMDVRYSDVVPGAYICVRMRRRDSWLNRWWQDQNTQSDVAATAICQSSERKEVSV